MSVSVWLQRLRFTPFYSYLSTRAIDWIDDANGGAAAGRTP
mgnify:CR=1 FL=1